MPPRRNGHGKIMTNPFGDLGGWVTGVIGVLGYVGIAVLIALENTLPAIPSEAILPLFGCLAGQGRFWLPTVVLAPPLARSSAPWSSMPWATASAKIACDASSAATVGG